MNKECSVCKKIKDVCEFAINKARATGHASECKECHKIVRRRYYEENQKKESSRVMARKREIQQWYQKYKSTLECVTCGEDHVATLDFHHRDPSTKDSMLSRVSQMGWGKERILEEIAKCDVLCANCHRKHHHTENNQ